jgi:hypothetical protein
LASSPLRGTDGLCASGRSAGLPGKRDAQPGLGRTRGPAHRAGPKDHLLTGEGSVVRQAHQMGAVERDHRRPGDSQACEQGPGLRSERPAGERRLGSEEQSEVQSCLGSRSGVGGK